MANRYARAPHQHDDDDEEELTLTQPVPTIASRHLTAHTSLGRPYKTDEEKLEQYTHLVRLKENRKTNQECADELGVSTRSIVNYLSDPYYEDVKTTLIAEAKARGHLQIADVIDDAVNKLHTLMQTARSEFVQYKSAEYLLKMAGYENMQEERERDNQADVIEFLSKLQGTKSKVQINVQVNQAGATASETIVDAVPFVPVLPDELTQYQMPMLPGGKLPTRED
jgi:hypothetical protein